MSRSGRPHAVPAVLTPLIAATALAAALLAPSAAVAKSTQVRYASPTGGSAASCNKAHPCELSTAVNDASSGDKVIVEPGTYAASTASPTLHATNVTIEGEPGHALPVINSSAQVAMTLTGGSLSHVKVVSSGHVAITSTGTVDHVVALVSGSGGAACEVTQGITDSLCVDSGANGVGIYLYYAPQVNATSHLHPAVFGVTAEATASTGTGLQLLADAKNVVTVRVTNSIVHGKKVDAEAETIAATAAATVLLKHSDYKTTAHKGSNGAPAVAGDATDIHKAPVFVDSTHGNYAEKASSATINKGTAAVTGDTDVAGHPRWLGSAPDMGAYEFREPPLVAGLTVTHSSAHSAKFSVQVNPEGLGTKVQVIALLGSKRVKSKVARAGAGRAYRTIHLHISGLRARSLYHIEAVVTNHGGSSHTQKKSLRTGA